MIKALRLNHINLNVKDIDRSLKFYQQAFGLEVKFWEGRTMVFLHSPGANDTITLCKAEPDDPLRAAACRISDSSLKRAARTKR